MNERFMRDFFRMPPGPEAMTLRDQLAASCLPAIYQHHTMFTCFAADLAYEQADEMLRARAKGFAAEEHEANSTKEK